ncbi:hypothetical protein [Nocardia sp. NPDC049707]|uniref:hypothetical protein n=1 Tax=Nocardia sp. NPDC049707 TaxID=3154735 RepID=UPI003430D791
MSPSADLPASVEGVSDVVRATSDFLAEAVGIPSFADAVDEALRPLYRDVTSAAREWKANEAQ